MSESPIGLVPAAGEGRRLGWWASKELYPVRIDDVPAPLGRLALDALRLGGCSRAVVVISEAKTDVVRVLADGALAGLSLGYVVQPRAEGLPAVIRCARDWLGDHPVALVLPDTFFAPRDAIRTLAERLREGDADVVLGVFPTDRPEALAPVVLREGWLERIQDKPAEPLAANTWGAVVWSPRFTRFCAEWDAARRGQPERTLSHAFEAAHREGLRVAGVGFPDGSYLDGGTPEGLAAVQAALDRKA